MSVRDHSQMARNAGEVEYLGNPALRLRLDIGEAVNAWVGWESGDVNSDGDTDVAGGYDR